VLVIAIVLCLCTRAIAGGTTETISTFNLGPEGGAFLSLVADSQNSGTLYAGSNNGGVFKTTDGGANWSYVGLTGFAVGVLAIDQNPSTLYAIASPIDLETGEINNKVFRSNGGTGWTTVTSGLPSECSTTGLAADSQHSGTLYTIACGSVFKSTDSGDTWSPASNGLTGIFAERLAIAQHDSNILYVVNNQCDQSGKRPPPGCDSRIFRSLDGAQTWTEATSTPLAGDLAMALVVDPQDSDTLYLPVTATGGRNGVSKSIDGGRTWTTPTAYGPGPLFISGAALAIDPRNTNTIYLSSFGTFKSTDGGQSWTSIYPGLFASIVVDPQSPGTVFGASSVGIVKSTDDGANWTALRSGLRAVWITAAAIDPQSPDTLYAAARCCYGYGFGYDGSLGLFKSSDKGKTWAAAGAGLKFDDYANAVVTLAVDPQTPSNLYAGVNGDGGCGGLFKSVDGGMTWSATGPAYSCPVSVVIDPQNPKTIYAATWEQDGIIKSIDGGTTWTPTPGFGSNTGVTALTIDPQNSQTLYAGVVAHVSGGGSALFKSTDGGFSWNSTLNLQGNNASAIAVDPQSPSTVYAVATVCCFLWGEAGGNLWKSSDGGGSWQDLSSGLPGPVSTIALDPRKPATIYAATNAGVIRSTDGGETWVPWSASTIGTALLLPDPKSDDTLYAGGPGGLFEIAPSSVTSITFDVAVVRVGASFTATIAGSNLSDNTYFDVLVRPPGSAADIVALNWQTGATESHSVLAGIDIGTWTVDGIRAHQLEADHTGEFIPVSAAITVTQLPWQ
jgi:photosystem II stability/assembly factor-like uncharacterized protein